MAENPSISTVIDWLVFRSFVLFIYQQNKHISITYSATPPFLYFLSRQTALEKLRWYLNQSHSYEQNHLWDVSLSCEQRMERLTAQMKRAQGITEQLKTENALEWTQRMNNIRACEKEIVEKEIILA